MRCSIFRARRDRCRRGEKQPAPEGDILSRRAGKVRRGVEAVGPHPLRARPGPAAAGTDPGMGARGPGGCRSAPRTWDTPSPVSPRTVKHSEAPFPLLSYRIDQRIQKLKSWFRKEGPRSFSTLLVASARRRRPVVPAARPPPGRKVRQVVSAGPRGQRPVGSDHYGQDSHRIAPEKAVARSR